MGGQCLNLYPLEGLNGSISDLVRFESYQRKDYGYILEGDVKYPTEIYDSNDELPFMCERQNINGVTKLVPNLRDKSKYAIHIRALAQVLDHGLIFERIHRAIEIQTVSLDETIHRFQYETQSSSEQRF